MGWWRERKYRNGRDLLTNLSDFTIKRHQVSRVSKWTFLLSLRAQFSHRPGDVSDVARKMPAHHWLFPKFEFSHTQNNQSGLLHGFLRSYLVRRHFPGESHTALTLG